MNQCSQCAQPGKLCRKCRTFLCHHHYVNHSCMIDKGPPDLDDLADERHAQMEKLDDDVRAEREQYERDDAL